MAYNIIPKSYQELQNILIDDKDIILSLYQHIIKLYNISDPFAFEKNNKKIKILRALQGSKIDIKKINTKLKYYKFIWGNGSRGKKGQYNRGLIFEKELLKNFNNFLFTDYNVDIKYKDLISFFVSLHKNNNYVLKNVEHEGSKNQRRQLMFKGNNIYINSTNFNIGSIISDLTLIYENKNGNIKKEYLSLKYGETLTFVNTGVKSFLKEQNIIEENYNDKALLFFEMFGIDKEKFSFVFNNYGKNTNKKEEILNITNKIDKNKLSFFLKSVIGYGYWLIHYNKGKIHYEYIDENKLNEWVKINNVKIRYPLDGSKKRIDIYVTLNKMQIKLNIRNKQGGIYPTHLMADYNFI